MTPDRQPISRIKKILSQALEHQAGADRNAFLNQACRGNDTLRNEVESLLAAYDTADELLSRDASGEALLDLPDLIGTMIGNYRLVEHIGEGGFGEVYRAEQTEPLRREVALKIIKLGMDSRNVIARFEAERQALALMNHPGIAQVYDAGATESGRPYFVMELVPGVPILEYCNRHRLSMPDRIVLFLQVCDAVQHAHQKGILHRDLKPSNILVSDENGKPQPKIIDFGIAKSLEGRLTEQTLATLQEMLIGTPMYMSPEQLSQDTTGVDTRSDIYSLGIVLYELLAGTTPLDQKTPTSMTMAGMRKAINEEELPRPSRRFHSLGNETTVIARERQIKPPTLKRLLRGDLDWVVMKAIEKERERRYPEVEALSQDLEHYLNHEPVSTGPPSVARRTGKFVRRHKTASAAVASAGVTMLLGICITTSSFFQLTKKPISLIEERNWKLEKFYDMGELGADTFGLRPDGSVLVVGKWGPMPKVKGLYRAKKGGTWSEADAFSIDEVYSDTDPKIYAAPSDVIELSDGIYVIVHGRKGRLFRIPIEGGDPQILLDNESIWDPRTILVAPQGFDGPNVDPGDLLIFDLADYGDHRSTIWAVNRSTGMIRPLITLNDNPLKMRFLHGCIAPDGFLYAGFSDKDKGLSGVSILRISAEGHADIVLENYRFPHASNVPRGQNWTFAHPYVPGVQLAAHPVTGEIYFSAYNEMFAFLPSKTSPRHVLSKDIKTLQWAPDGSRLYIMADKAVWTLSGTGIESQPVSIGQDQ